MFKRRTKGVSISSSGGFREVFRRLSKEVFWVVFNECPRGVMKFKIVSKKCSRPWSVGVD